MNPAIFGLPTYHTRVERWECDYNDHWNVKFFGRSFQMAFEYAATLDGSRNPGASNLRTRHIRFHREMKLSAPVEIRSAHLAIDGRLNGTIVHHMLSNGMVAATAIDEPGLDTPLPTIDARSAEQALPRGILSDAGEGTLPTDTAITAVVLGPVRSTDIDHTGTLLFEQVLRHGSNVQHAQLNQLGLTPEYAAENNINRMGVEFRITMGTTPEIGTCLTGSTWLTEVRDKTFMATIRIGSPTGELVALIEMCVVTVDLTTRKAVQVPGFIRDAMRK